MNRAKALVALLAIVLVAGCTPAAAAEPDVPGFPDPVTTSRTRPAPDPTAPAMPDDPGATRTRPAPDPSQPAFPGGGGCS